MIDFIIFTVIFYIEFFPNSIECDIMIEPAI